MTPEVLPAVVRVERVHLQLGVVRFEHEILFVQWRDRLKRVVWPQARAEAALEV